MPVAGRCSEIVIDDSDHGERALEQVEHLRAETKRLRSELEELRLELAVAQADAAAHSDAARVVAEVTSREVDRLRELLAQRNDRSSLFRKMSGRLRSFIRGRNRVSSTSSIR